MFNYITFCGSPLPAYFYYYLNYIVYFLDEAENKITYLGTEHLGTEHLGTEHLGTEHLGTEHLGTEHF